MADNSFWLFMVQRYAYKDVEECCLYLQNQYQVNVVLLLWLCWLDSENTQPDLSLFQSAKDFALNFDRSYTSVLRRLRREIKMDHSLASADRLALRESILETELSFEHALAESLFEFRSNYYLSGRSIDSLQNPWLSLYLDPLNILDRDSLVHRLMA